MQNKMGCDIFIKDSGLQTVIDLISHRNLGECTEYHAHLSKDGLNGLKIFHSALNLQELIHKSNAYHE